MRSIPVWVPRKTGDGILSVCKANTCAVSTGSGTLCSICLFSLAVVLKKKGQVVWRHVSGNVPDFLLPSCRMAVQISPKISLNQSIQDALGQKQDDFYFWEAQLGSDRRKGLIHTGRVTRQCNARKWDLLLSMGVFTLLTSNIKRKTFQFGCASRRASCVNWAQADFLSRNGRISWKVFVVRSILHKKHSVHVTLPISCGLHWLPPTLK